MNYAQQGYVLNSTNDTPQVYPSHLIGNHMNESPAMSQFSGENYPPTVDQFGFFSYRGEYPATKSENFTKYHPKRRGMEIIEEEISRDSLLKKIFLFCTEGISGIFTALITFMLIVALFIWPGILRPKSLDAEKTEKQVKLLVEQTFGWSGISKIHCDTENVRVRKGNSFMCNITSNDAHVQIEAQFTNNKGDYSLSKPIFGQ